MALRYWVGGTANWDNTAGTKWALTSGGAGGQAIPTVNDDVFFTNLSTGTCSILTGAAARSVNCTGFTGELAGGQGFSLNNGTLTLVAGMTYTHTGTWTFAGSTTVTLTTAGKTLGGVTINKAGASLLLGGALTVSASGSINLLAGTLGGSTISTGFFASSGTTTRSCSATITLTGSGTVLSMGIVTGFSGTPSFIRDQATTATVAFGTTGGSSLNAPNLTVNAGASDLSMSGWFKNVDFTGSTCTVSGSFNFVGLGAVTLASGGTYTGLSLFTFTPCQLISNGRTLGSVTANSGNFQITGPLTLNSTSTFTLSQGTLILGGTLSTGIFSSSTSVTRAIAFGAHSIALTSTTAAATVLSMATATNFSYTGTGNFTRDQAATATVVFGTTGGTTSNAPNLTVNAGASALTITTGSYFKNVDFTSSTSTVTAAGPTGLNMAGNLTLASGGTYTAVISTFRASGTITSNGKTLGGMTVNAAGITVTLADAAAMNFAGGSFTLTLGTINLAGFTLFANRLDSSNSNVRSIDFGSGGSIALDSGVGGDMVLMATATNFTWAGTGGINLTGILSTGNYAFGSTGGTSTNVLDVTVSISSAGILTFTAGTLVRSINCISGLCFLATQGGGSTTLYGNLTLASGGTYTTFAPTFLASATVTSTGKTLGNTTVNGSGITVTLADAMTLGTASVFLLTQGALDLASSNLSTGVFSSSGTNTRAISFGSGNIALTSTTAVTTVLSMATATGFTWTGTGGFTRNMLVTATVNFGATAGGSTTNAPNLTVTNTAALTITNGSYFKTVDFTGANLTATGSYNACDSLTLGSLGTYTALAPTFLASGTITSAGRALSSTTVNGSGITVTLADDLTLGTSNTLTLTAGTLNFDGWTVSVGLFSSSNSNTRTLNLGSTGSTFTITGSGASAWNTTIVTGLTLSFGVANISMTSASAKTFNGGGLIYPILKQGGAGALTISGSNTFDSITNTVQPATVTFTAGTTQTVSTFGLSGTAGNLITINSDTPGTQFNLSKSSGTVTAQNLSIQDSNATGGAGWYASNSTNLGNTTGWNFQSPNMFAFLL